MDRSISLVLQSQDAFSLRCEACVDALSFYHKKAFFQTFLSFFHRFWCELLYLITLSQVVLVTIQFSILMDRILIIFIKFPLLFQFKVFIVFLDFIFPFLSILLQWLWNQYAGEDLIMKIRFTSFILILESQLISCSVLQSF